MLPLIIGQAVPYTLVVTSADLTATNGVSVRCTGSVTTTNNTGLTGNDENGSVRAAWTQGAQRNPYPGTTSGSNDVKFAFIARFAGSQADLPDTVNSNAQYTVTSTGRVFGGQGQAQASATGTSITTTGARTTQTNDAVFASLASGVKGSWILQSDGSFVQTFGNAFDASLSASVTTTTQNALATASGTINWKMSSVSSY